MKNDCTWDVIVRPTDTNENGVDCLTEADCITVTRLEKDRFSGAIKELSCNEYYTLTEALDAADALGDEPDLLYDDECPHVWESQGNDVHYVYEFDFNAGKLRGSYECNGSELMVDEALDFTLHNMSEVKQRMTAMIKEVVG